MKTFDFSRLRPIPSFLRSDSLSKSLESQTAVEAGLWSEPDNQSLDTEHTQNDGIVPIFSQYHPLPCRYQKHYARIIHHIDFFYSSTCCKHLESNTVVNFTDLELKPNTWYVNQVDAATHITLVPFWVGSERQRAFWTNMGKWLKAVESTSSIILS
jgi:hypothetical protein